MNVDQPLAKTMITILTPSFNRVDMISNAVESVLAQNFPAFEHIIVDGGSTDGTLEILKQYPHLKIISQLDQGMYEALNKGLERARGEIIGFLNTDDLYGENMFDAVVRQFERTDIMAVTGRAVVFRELRGGKIELVESYSPKDRNLMENLARGGAFFNAWFFRRSTFDRIGKFNPNFKIVGDTDFMFRFALSDLKYAAIDELMYKYRMHEQSLTFGKTGEKRAWSADEHLTMVNFHLVKENLPDSAKKLLMQVRTSETVDMAARSIWMRNYENFLHYALEGSKSNPFWLLKFLQYVLRRGVALLTRRPAKQLH